MTDDLTYLGFIAFYAGLPIMCFFVAYKGIRSGTIYAKGHPYSRYNEPIFFWITVGLYIALALGVGYYGVLFGIAFWKNG